jgi:DNA-binding HxlR family transcriptional regulator
MLLPMAWLDYDSRTCSIARTLEILGERWTVLVLRDLFNGVHRFEDLQRHLNVARDVLAKRLNTLVEAGVVDRVAYQEAGARRRHEYRLTPAGRELRPALVALMDWGDKHLADPDGPPMVLEHVGCGATVHAPLICEKGHRIKKEDALQIVPQPAARLTV